jgi:hypothetical protein
MQKKTLYRSVFFMYKCDKVTQLKYTLNLLLTINLTLVSK